MSFPHIYIIYFYFLSSFSHSSPLSTSFCHFLRLLLSFLSPDCLVLLHALYFHLFCVTFPPFLFSVCSPTFSPLSFLLPHIQVYSFFSPLLLSFFSVMYWPHPFSSHLSLSFPSFHLSCLCLSSPLPSISIPPSPPSLSLSLFLHHLSLLLSFSRHLLSPPPQLLSSPTKKRNEGEEAGVMSDEGTSVEEVELSLKSQHGNNSYSAQTSSRRHSSTSRPLHPAPLHLLFTSSAVSLSCLSYCSPCLFLISIIRQGFQIFLSFFFSLSEFFMFRKEMLLERTQNLTIIK